MLNLNIKKSRATVNNAIFSAYCKSRRINRFTENRRTVFIQKYSKFLENRCINPLYKIFYITQPENSTAAYLNIHNSPQFKR